MRIPTLAALCCGVALTWACDLDNQPGNELERPGVEDRTGGMERDVTEREVTPRERAAPAMMDCPMEVTGTTVRTVDADGSVAMTFTTTTGDVEELRESVKKLSEKYERRAQRRDDREDGGATPRQAAMPDATTAVENVDGGARIVFVPEDASELDELRERVRVHEERMSSTGKCGPRDQDEQGEL